MKTFARHHRIDSHHGARQLASDHPQAVRLGRVGWLAKGIVYLLAGALALLLAIRSTRWSDVVSLPGANGTTPEASPTGALKEVAHSGGGPLLLIAMAIGLFLYAGWRIMTALLPSSGGAKSTVTRIGYMISALMYLSFGITAISLARSPETVTNGDSTVRSMSGRVMQHTSGRWVIGIVGLIVVGAGLYRLSLGLRTDVTDDIDLGGMSGGQRTWTKRLGSIGEIGRGVAMLLIGVFLLRAAQSVDPSRATGLDGALRRTAQRPWGMALVIVVGIGFMAYGLFCALTFTRRRLVAA